MDPVVWTAVPTPWLGRRDALCGPAGRGADRRSALQAVPALMRGRRYALCGPVGRVPTGGRRSKPSPRLCVVGSTRFAALRAACRPEVGGPSRSRAFSRSARRALRPCGPRADRRSAFQAVPALFRGRRGALCGPAGRVPAGGRRSKPSPRLCVVGSTRFAALRAACRPEVGAPSRPRTFAWSARRALRPCGPRADRRSAFQAVRAILRVD